MDYKIIVVGPLETNCYLVYCENTKECAVIDPGANPRKIFREIAESELRPVVMINTHGHIDHVGANMDVKEKYDIPLLIHPGDRPMLDHVLQSELALFLEARESPAPDGDLEDGQTIQIGTKSLHVIHTPGHSPGSISLLGDGFVLSGDSLFYGGVGRTDLPGGSWDDLVTSIKTKILTLPEETVVLPGHGPHTSVGQEKDINPFIR